MITVIYLYIFLINISFHRDGHPVFPKSRSPENSSLWPVKANGKICLIASEMHLFIKIKELIWAVRYSPSPACCAPTRVCLIFPLKPP